MSTLSTDYAARIRSLLQEFGVAAGYAADRDLQLQPEATHLAPIGLNPEGNDVLLTPPAARAWHQMHAAAHAIGIDLIPLSGFRSVNRQTEIIRGKLALGESIGDILRSIAAPGYSEHHSGRAIDIGTANSLPLEETFADTPAFAWLVRHGDEFGFKLSYPRHNRHGFVYEPWHWCWHP